MADETKERQDTLHGVSNSTGDEAGKGSDPTSIPSFYEPQALSEVSVIEDENEIRYIGQVVGGKYRLDRKIGQGGMGEVYLGINDELGQRVAVKFLNQRFAHDEGIVQRFLNEARSYCRVNHPNAVTLLEYGQHDDGTLYIITEFVEGMNLAQTMKDRGLLAIPQVVAIGIQLCDVLEAAHAEGVIHRDLKPDNLMLIPTARSRFALKVLDFGIAKIIDEDDAPNTETGSVFGTPEFMSPEQARGETADARSDIYAVGIILFFMLTGKLPFKGKNKLVVLNKQLHERPVRPSELRDSNDIPLKFEAVVMKCLNKGRAERYDSAEDLMEALEELDVPRQGTKKANKDNTRPQLRADTLRLGPALDRDTDPHADTMAQNILDRVVSADLESIDLSREQYITESGTRRDSSPQIAGMVALGALLVIVAVLVMNARQDPEMDVQNVLVTGQVVGLLAAAEDMIKDGNLESATKSISQTQLWLDDSALPEKIVDRRQELLAQITEIEAGVEKFQASVRVQRCDDARSTLALIKPASPGLVDPLSRALVRCELMSTRQNEPRPVPAKPDDSATPSKAAPKVAPKVVPKVEPKVEPQPESDLPDVPADTELEADPEVDEGMALPPKLIP